MTTYRVEVGNIGMVYEGEDVEDARSTFNVYVEQSKSGSGRAAGEDVLLFEGDDIEREYTAPESITIERAPEAALRSIKLSTGHTLTTWDNQTRAHTGQYQLRYEFRAPASVTVGPTLGAVIFEGTDYGVSPMHSIDSDAALLGLLGFLTLRHGDTDSEYFANYTDAQREWSESSACESLACEVSTAEEIQGCACILWTNLDGWGCEDAGTVADFEVLDHGEDGSQYFPGCGVGKFDHVATGVGDTGAEAFDDALEQMAMSEPEARMSPLQEHWARQSLSDPDKSAFEALDHSECGEDHDGDDWSHYVSIRYTARG